MKNKIAQWGAVGIASFAIAVSAIAGQSGGQNTSFQVTNYIAGAGGSSNVTSWPTNTLGTNGIGTLTGGPVSIGIVDHIGLNLQGYLVVPTYAAGTNGIIGITLLPSMASSQSQPAVTLGTNVYTGTATNVALGLGYLQNDWASTNGQVTITFTPTAGTNWINFQTNMDSPAVWADANYIGVYAISNNLGPTGFLTNLVISVNTKLQPKPLQ